jgi:outer membrane protein assembly factor BamE (lipoprotein component of BamABCDE complex)
MGLEMERFVGLIKSLSDLAERIMVLLRAMIGRFRRTGALSRTRRRMRWAAIGLVSAGMLLACEKEVRIRGHVPDPDSMEAIKAGLHSRDDVLELLGTPSTISTFDDQKWYYIGQKSIQFAYKRPRILDRNVVVVSFDESGYVTETTFYSLEDAQEIKPVARVTPTEGRDFTVLQQLLGNFGRLPSGVQSSPDLPGP